jgi:hypothetical protein
MATARIVTGRSNHSLGAFRDAKKMEISRMRYPGLQTRFGDVLMLTNNDCTLFVVGSVRADGDTTLGMERETFTGKKAAMAHAKNLCAADGRMYQLDADGVTWVEFT